MEHKKLLFETSVIWKEKSGGVMIAPSADEAIEVATPIEFPDGVEGKWSPESLLLGAISSCFMTTFLSLAKRKDLAFIKFTCHAEGVVEPVEGKLQFTEVNLFPELHLFDEDQRSLGNEVLVLSEKYCLVGNSLNSNISMHPVIETEVEFFAN